MRHVLRLLAALLPLAGCTPTITVVMPAAPPRTETPAAILEPAPADPDQPVSIEQQLKDLLVCPRWL